MVAQKITQDLTQNPDFNHPSVEVVAGTTQSTDGDFWDSVKFSQIEGAFASQRTTDGDNVQVSWSGRRVTVVPTTAASTISLIIHGRK